MVGVVVVAVVGGGGGVRRSIGGILVHNACLISSRSFSTRTYCFALRKIGTQGTKQRPRQGSPGKQYGTVL